MKISAEFLTEKMAKKYADAVKEKFDCEVSLNKASVNYDVPKSETSVKNEKDYATYDEMDTRIEYVYDHINYKFRYLQEEISYVLQLFRDHMKGHLPKIKSTSQMKTALEALGLEDEYEVMKPIISVANKKTGEIIVE